MEKHSAEDQRLLTQLALPLNCLCKDTPARTREIEITGFPIGLGVRPEVSPLVMKGYIASREMQVEAKWGTEPILLAVPVVGAGCSGGPVFVSCNDPTELSVAGMYVGTMLDNSGVKLSKIVPAHVIREAIELTGRPAIEANPE